MCLSMGPFAFLGVFGDWGFVIRGLLHVFKAFLGILLLFLSGSSECESLKASESN